jgi:endonuclease III related protein
MKAEKRNSPEATVREIYRTLAHSWGPQHWWPADGPLEVIVGAILTQNTSWKNVERAMASLRSAGALSIAGIRDLSLEQLEQLVRSSGYYRQKASRLKTFVAFLDEKYGGSLERMFAAPTLQLRAELLSLKGIGHETADSILLYAGNHEIFVVDAYARRVFERHGTIAPSAKYDEIRALVERALRGQQAHGTALESNKPIAHEPSPMSSARRSPLAQVYNEMHGLLVQVGKNYCHKAEAKCEQCPVRALLPKDPAP